MSQSVTALGSKCVTDALSRDEVTLEYSGSLVHVSEDLLRMVLWEAEGRDVPKASHLRAPEMSSRGWHSDPT